MSVHTALDRAVLRSAGVDPDVVPARDQWTPCRSCGALTANLAGNCLLHYRPPSESIER